jgi:NAD(P)-dependent dehydrogenase (short-subunit alcohol dehydrogenase family)
MSLEGRVALVTGAGQGIGQTVATVLAAHGAAVAVNDLLPRTAEATVDAILEGGGTAMAAPADVSQADAVSRMVEQVERAWGGIDILVNNAAYMSMALLVDLPEIEWDRVLAVDLKGPYLTCRAVLPGMLARRRGRIVNISSEWGVTGAAGAAHYAAAKAGLIGLTRSLAREVAERGVLVNAIAPGVIDTPQLLVDADFAGKPLQAMKDVYSTAIPVGRLGRPRDVALTVLMLVLESGDFYSGQVLMPNGGAC